MVLKVAGFVMLAAGMAGIVSATPVVGPEIDAATAANALALLAGAVLIIRSRKR